MDLFDFLVVLWQAVQGPPSEGAPSFLEDPKLPNFHFFVTQPRKCVLDPTPHKPCKGLHLIFYSGSKT
jgi:hypothetical protein